MLAHNLPPKARIRTLLNQGRFWWHARRRGRGAPSPGPLFATPATPLYLRDLFILRAR
jgi:hypothetical protein